LEFCANARGFLTGQPVICLQTQETKEFIEPISKKFRYITDISIPALPPSGMEIAWGWAVLKLAVRFSAGYTKR
jgi:hypothetical protein